MLTMITMMHFFLIFEKGILRKGNVFASKYSLSLPPSSLFPGATPGEPTQKLGGGGTESLHSTHTACRKEPM